MTTDINLSLDDIIKKNKSSGNFNPRRRQGQNNTGGGNRRNSANGRTGGSGGGKINSGRPRFQNNVNRSRSAARYTPYKRVSILNQIRHTANES